MFTVILRWLGFNLGFKDTTPVQQVKFVPVKEALVEVEAIMDAGTTHPAALIDVEEERVIAAHEVLEVFKKRDERIFDLGKPITCLMIDCKGCDKIDPVKGCIAYEDPSLLLWHKLGQWCPLNSVPQKVVAKKKVKVNPQKASRRAALAAKAAS